MKFLLFVLVFLLVPVAYAATIQGTIYDLELNKVNSIVTIDSIPPQRQVASDGKYSFEVQKGTYLLVVKSIKANITLAYEDLIVETDGTYNVDIILLPEDELEELDLEDIDIPDAEDLESPKNFGSPFGKLILVISLILLFFIVKSLVNKYRNKPAEIEKEDINNVLDIIKKEGGRINQKDLRKHFALSEAKMSRLTSELESKGKVQKIKKGRSNILVLK